MAETFDERNATSPVHKVQADHYAGGLKLSALHANGAMIVGENAAALAGICQSLASMKDVRPRCRCRSGSMPGALDALGSYRVWRSLA